MANIFKEFFMTIQDRVKPACIYPQCLIQPSRNTTTNYGNVAKAPNNL